MIDPSHVGAQVQSFTTQVDDWRLRFFAEATGQDDPAYHDPAVARARGWPGLPVPPTFLFCLESDAPDPLAVFRLLEVDLGRVLHGEQHFRYHRMAFAGEPLTFRTHVADIYARKGGAMEFVVLETQVTDRGGAPVAELGTTLVVRNG